LLEILPSIDAAHLDLATGEYTPNNDRSAVRASGNRFQRSRLYDAAAGYQLDFNLVHDELITQALCANCCENSVAESFFSSLKNELVHHCSFRTRDEARTAIFKYIEVFYKRPPHTSIAGLSQPAKL
jgi:hypothetical protein